MSAFKLHAHDLLERGYSPIPVLHGTKRPLGKCAFYEHWDELRSKALLPQQIDILARSNFGLGVVGGYNCLVPIDFDTDDCEIKRAAIKVLPPVTVAKVGKRGGTTFYWNSDGLIDGCKFQRKSPDGKGWEMLIEILATGKTTLPPSIHPDTGLPYKWVTDATLFNTKIDDLPEIRKQHIDDLRAALQPWLPPPVAFTRAYSSAVTTDDHIRAYAKAALRQEVIRLSSLSEGRNWGIFKAACKLGRFVNHGALSEAELQGALLQASRTNGYAQVKHGGLRQAFKTLRSGLKKSQGDPLPDLALGAKQKTGNYGDVRYALG
jgi:hypothetical protein